MSIKTFNIPMPSITVCQVSCQESNCAETIVVENWRDAEKHGWSVPVDGHFQMCPKCYPSYVEKLFANAITPEEYKKQYMNKS